MNRIASFLSLFGSFGTLICCALPALFVSIGAGATLAAGISAFPQLVWFSENKALVFGFAGAMLLLSLYLQCTSSPTACPTDPELALACRSGKKASKVILWVSCLLYLIGGFFAFVLPLFM